PEELAEIRPDAARRPRADLFDDALTALRHRLGETRIPLYMGGHGLEAVTRAAEHGEGWMPGWRPIAELRERVALLRTKEQRAGRAPRSVTVAPELSARIARRHEDAVAAYETSRFVRHRISRDTASRDGSLMARSNLVGSA